MSSKEGLLDEGEAYQMRRTVTLKELGLTGDAWAPLSISVVVFLLAALTGLLVTFPAWPILGIGRAFLPGFLMPVTAFVMLVVTTGGLTVAWGGGSVSLLVLWEILGKKTTFATVRLLTGTSLLVVWFLVAVFLHIYAALEPELEAQVLSQSSALHFALYTFHRFNDVMHFVFAAGALGMIWGYGEGLLRNRVAQVITLSLIWLTFFSLSLTVGLHSAAVRMIAG
ncbi:MAG: hypothetical protein ACE5IQ_07445 [Candidatus Methylomirabilales bacterium]